MNNNLSNLWGVNDSKVYLSNISQLAGLEDKKGLISLKNIGDNQENLSVALLSYNRSHLTIKFLDSLKDNVPNFKGEIILGDNGSSKEELENLYNYSKEYPFEISIYEFGENLGVAGGRNKLFHLAKHDWIFSIDNDMYFTSNPFNDFQKAISTLGVKFLNVPFLNEDRQSGICGGTLFMEEMDNDISISICGSLRCDNIVMDVPGEPFLCTGVLGGASILNKELFINLGGFESNMKVGFEDTEFSLRVFQAGYKVGGSRMFSLIHDHPKPTKAVDIDYEKERHSYKTLYESAKYFEKKHGFNVWNSVVDNWMKSRQDSTQTKFDEVYIKKVALVVDSPNWAFSNIARQIIKNNSDKFEFKIIVTHDIPNITDVFMQAKNCDIIHFFWRPQINFLNYYDCIKRMNDLGYTKEEFFKKFVNNKKITTSVYDHLLLEGEDYAHTEYLFFDEKSLVNAYSVSSKKLFNLYSNFEDINIKPQLSIPDGVDLTMFKPMNMSRFDNLENRTIKCGWVGNSKWQVSDLKGINTIIKPAIENLQNQGYDIELITSDRNDKMIEHKDMPEFYSNLDIYICASICEGTANPVLESMACGLAIVATDVGLVPEAFGEKQTEYILQERSIKALVEKLKTLLDNKEKIKELSSENIESIKVWDWKLIAPKFAELWQTDNH